MREGGAGAPPSFLVMSLPLSQAKQKLSDLAVLGRLYVSDRRAFRVIRHVMSERLSYLEAAALLDLYRAVQNVETAQREGRLIEAGVALGGSAIVMATAKEKARPLYLYDAFEMIPPPSERDGTDAHSRYEEIASGGARGLGGQAYYGYQDNLYEQVRRRLRDAGFPPQTHAINLVRGFYEETLHVDEPVALAHLDCDWYDSVMVCLQRIEPHLAPGGVLVIDDYEHWSGCRKAVDDYFRERREQYHFVMASRLHIIRR